MNANESRTSISSASNLNDSCGRIWIALSKVVVKVGQQVGDAVVGQYWERSQYDGGGTTVLTSPFRVQTGVVRPGVIRSTRAR